MIATISLVGLAASLTLLVAWVTWRLSKRFYYPEWGAFETLKRERDFLNAKLLQAHLEIQELERTIQRSRFERAAR